MTSVFDADDIVLRPRPGNVFAGTVDYELTDSAGSVLATVRHEAGRGLLGRLFSHRPGLSAADLDVVDPAGARLLGIAKARSAAGSLDLAVSLADGQLVGSASGAARRSRDIVLYDPSDTELGRLWRDSAVSTTLLAPGGDSIGRLERQLRTRAGGPLTYRLQFAPAAAVAVRILTLATAIAGVLQRSL